MKLLSRWKEKSIPDEIQLELRSLCGGIAKRGLLLGDSVMGEACRFTFCRAFESNPDLFIYLMSGLVKYLRQLSPIVWALRAYPEISYRQGRRIIVKPINQACDKEILYFIEEEFKVPKDSIKAASVARCRQRLAEKDAPWLWRRQELYDRLRGGKRTHRSKMTKEK